MWNGSKGVSDSGREGGNGVGKKSIGKKGGRVGNGGKFGEGEVGRHGW